MDLRILRGKKRKKRRPKAEAPKSNRLRQIAARLDEERGIAPPEPVGCSEPAEEPEGAPARRKSHKQRRRDAWSKVPRRERNRK